MMDLQGTTNPEIRDDSIESSVAEMVSRAFRWGAGTTGELREWENRVSSGMLGEVENEFQALAQGKWSNLRNLVERIRHRVERGMSDAETEIGLEIETGKTIWENDAAAEKDLRRLKAAKAYVLSRMESKMSTIYEMGGDVAASYLLRMSRQIQDVETEKTSLSLRLSRLNFTLQEALTKFRNHASRLESEKAELVASRDCALKEKEAAVSEKTRAISERDVAISEKNLALEESAKAKAETRTAKNLYEKVAAKAKKADSINALLRWRGFYSDTFEKNVATLLADYESAKREVEKLSGERESYQKATAHVFELERRISELERGETPEFKQVRAEVEIRERQRVENGLRTAAAGYLTASFRLHWSDPESGDYADCERHSKDVESFAQYAKNLGVPAFDLVQAEMENIRDVWANNKPLLAELGISKSIVLKTYERCVREAGEWMLPVKTAKKVVERLRFYREIAGIGKKTPPSASVTDAELR